MEDKPATDSLALFKHSSQAAELDTEIQLVSALAKLQRLEATIHQLRSLLPTRLLAPLAPVIQPREKTGSESRDEKLLPESPQVLYQQLSHSARSSVEEVRQFQAMWRSPEMKPVWGRVESDIRELGGLLQPTGMWEVDYDEILEELITRERTKAEQAQRQRDEEEYRMLQSTRADWRGIVKSFVKKDMPGVRVDFPKNDSEALLSVTVTLIKIGIILQVHNVARMDDAAPNWRVVTNSAVSGQRATKLENGIVGCLNSRDRHWDLGYLLDMISSYADIKQAPCKKCSRMTDSSANIPFLRKPVVAVSNDQHSFIFEPYHPGCI